MKHTRLITLLLAFLVIMAGCSPAGTPGEEAKELNIFTWIDYFPADIIAEFEADTGITVNYATFESNEEMLLKLEAAEGGDYDIVLASDYIIDIASKEGLVGELNKELIPNFANINPGFQSQYYDPDNLYTVPYAAGIPLIVYNPTMIDFVPTGYEDLWNPALADSVVAMDDARNIIGITLKTMGQSFNVTDKAVLDEAKAKLFELKPNIRALDYNLSHNLLISGEASIGYVFTSQVVEALEANSDLKVVYPKEGLGFGIDSCFVPVNAPHPDNAMMFLDYILDPERSARISDQTKYINCTTTAAEYLLNPALSITEDQIAGAEFIKDVGDATSMYTDIWTEFKLQ